MLDTSKNASLIQGEENHEEISYVVVRHRSLGNRVAWCGRSHGPAVRFRRGTSGSASSRPAIRRSRCRCGNPGYGFGFGPDCGFRHVCRLGEIRGFTDVAAVAGIPGFRGKPAVCSVGTLGGFNQLIAAQKRSPASPTKPGICHVKMHFWYMLLMQEWRDGY